MAEHNLAVTMDDDLPRTLRREKEAREREARDRDYQLSAAPPMPTHDRERDHAVPAFAEDLQPAAVRRLEIPFLHMVAFFLKAVLAAIPALILLGVILWFAGHLLQAYFPQLVKMQIFIQFPQ